MANPALSIEPVFEAGLAAEIPIIQQQTVLTNNLPPWKTSQLQRPPAD